MCMFSTPDAPEVKAPVRYAQQRTPTRRDTGNAQERAANRRKRATNTLLTDESSVDYSGKKTLLGA